MTADKISVQKLNAFITIPVVVSFLLFSLAVKAQTPADYSGKWQYDKALSDKDERGNSSFNGTIIMEIIQDAATITITNTFIRPGMKDYVMQPDSYFLDGKVTTDNSGTGPARKYAKWSPDKKILTTTLVMTDKIDGVAQDFITAFTYKLSADGKTLTVAELNKSKLNGEKTVKNIYKKK
jgi:hypothetical protein